MKVWPSVAVVNSFDIQVDLSVSTANYIFTKRVWNFLDYFRAFMNRISPGLRLHPTGLWTEGIWPAFGYSNGFILISAAWLTVAQDERGT